ncbi:DNA alkylation repair protein [Candidatus Woesearchaeota archaeon]|nr:DNA alkylation repair protein [Candidatus Woesearchaeota archaeon]
MIDKLISEMQQNSDRKKAILLQKFFKTGKGEYGEGDKFLGITVPNQRKLAAKYKEISLNELQKLISSRIHEHRLTALLILIGKYKRKDDKRMIFEFYIKNRGRINNWDLVDLSSEKIIGDYLLDKDKGLLYKMAESRNVWERRIAIIATFRYIRENQFNDTLKISEMMLGDKHDLIHKAVGWMLREIGKRDQKKLDKFLENHHKRMPRTMLRYAIERMDEKKRMMYMSSGAY